MEGHVPYAVIGARERGRTSSLTFRRGALIQLSFTSKWRSWEDSNLRMTRFRRPALCPTELQEPGTHTDPLSYAGKIWLGD